MKAPTDTAIALCDLRASLRAEGSSPRLGRGCGPYFGQGLRSTFVNLGLLHGVKYATRKREAESALLLDRIASSALFRSSCRALLYVVLLGSVVWGAGNVMASVRLNGASSASAKPIKMDAVASVEVQDAVDRLLRSFKSDHREYLALSSSVNPQAARFCAAAFSSLDLRESPRVDSSFPGSDSSFLEAKVQFQGRRPLYFMFRKSPGLPGLQFAGLRPELR